MSEYLLLPGDLFFTRGPSRLSRWIRACERSPGEEPSVINHVGTVAGVGTIKTAPVVEALREVERHTLYEQYHGKQDYLTIYRPIGITFEQRMAIGAKAGSYVGRKYGWFKIVNHGSDYLLSRAVGRDIYLFRRLCRNGKYPICSWVSGYSVYAVLGWKFKGLDPSVCQPDDMWDDIMGSRPPRWKPIMQLQHI